MERRDNRRFARRIEIRFWRRGEDQSHSAFTTNLSRTGLFLGTAMSLVAGERLRLQVIDGDNDFMVEGQVARVHRVSPALRQLAQAGVGVRFFMPEELIQQVFPANARQAPLGSATSAPPPQVSAQDPPEPPEPARTEPNTNAQGADTPVPANSRIVPVAFSDASAFLSVYHRDIQFGGLFVSTEAPGELNEVIWVELQVPLDGTLAIPVAARVVQRFEPKAAVGGGGNLVAGMAVQFLEPEKVLTDLKPLLPRLRS